MSYAVKQVIVFRKDIQVRKGKFAAQVAHASMGFLTENDSEEDPRVLHVKLSPSEQEWFRNGTPKIVVGCSTLEELEELITRADFAGIEAYKVTDRGHTEFHGVPTVTCAAFGPHESGELDKLTGHLKLL